MIQASWQEARKSFSASQTDNQLIKKFSDLLCIPVLLLRLQKKNTSLLPIMTQFNSFIASHHISL
jgi:hypothetical protein